MTDASEKCVERDDLQVCKLPGVCLSQVRVVHAKALERVNRLSLKSIGCYRLL